MKSYEISIKSAHTRCSLNTVSSSMIYRYLLKNNHRIINDSSKADFIIINSCGFHKKTRDASINLYNKLNNKKKQNAKIIMFGCLIKIDNERLQSLNLIQIDFNDNELLDKYFFQNTKYNEMTPHCDTKTREVILQEESNPDFSKYPNFFLSRKFLRISPKTKSNYEHLLFGMDHNDKLLVEISRGCIGNCYYCTIKKTKGQLKSRKVEEIILDIKSIYDPTKILFLAADDCSCYGLDIDTNIFQLINRIENEFPGLSFQMNYLSPNLLDKFSKDYIELFSRSNILFITIPMQSGSNKIIRNMNRNYDSRRIFKIIKQIKKVSPKTLIEGHFIIGYPGETSFDFFKTIFATVYFDYPIALIYSDSKGVKSSTLPKKKSSITKYLRFLIITFFINFVILFKFLTNSSFDPKT